MDPRTEGRSIIEAAAELRDAVRRAYSAAAEKPVGRHPFPVGPRFAASLDYPPEILGRIPDVAVEAFSGVSNVAVIAEIPTGATVLDLGCGAGLDTLVAAWRVGSTGRVVGVDFSGAMLERARRAAAQAGAANVLLLRADAESLPVPDGTVDVALVNGIFNLNPYREPVFRELARVARAGGAVYAAELILREQSPAPRSADPGDWFA